MVSEHGFSRIKSLPEDQLLHVNNWLARGGEVMALTRHIQQEWKLWVDVNERTLCMQLNRYKKWLQANSAPDLPELRTKEGAVVVKATRTRNIDVLERLVTLVAIQEKRIQMFIDQEAAVKMPLAGVDKVIDSTKELLKDMQKIRFDLGLDEYKGVVQGGTVVRGGSKTTVNPDGSSTTSMLFEAVTLADQILGRAAIPENLKILGRDVEDAQDRS